MRLIKRQTTNLRSPNGKGVIYDVWDQVTLDSNNNVLVPRGTTNERPLTPDNGMLRYNTDRQEFEFYQDGAWRDVRAQDPVEIVQQNLGAGDDSTLHFGPLNSGDPDFPVPISPQSIIVLVENVFQIPVTNYTLEQNPAGFSDGWYVKFGTPPPTGKPVTVLHNFDK